MISKRSAFWYIGLRYYCYIFLKYLYFLLNFTFESDKDNLRDYINYYKEINRAHDQSGLLLSPKINFISSNVSFSPLDIFFNAASFNVFHLSWFSLLRLALS
jgi:hypothetical protein